MTEQEVRAALDGWERLRKRAIEVGRELCALHKRKSSPCEDAEVSIEPFYGELQVNLALSGGEGIWFPLAYLWQPDWAEREQARIDAARAEAAAKKAQEEADREQLFEQRDQEDYERLWHKYKGRQP